MKRRTFVKAAISAPFISLIPRRLQAQAPIAGFEKIENIVVLMLENRSFDSMLGKLYEPSEKFNGLTGKEFNTDEMGNKFFVNNVSNPIPSPLNIPTPNPGELWIDMNEQLYGKTGLPGNRSKPNMEGFVRNYIRQQNGNLPFDASGIMHYFKPEQVPIISKLARQYAVIDTWHASAPCQTWPNRFFAHAGTAGGKENNAPFSVPFTMPTIFTRLSEVYGSEGWKIYYHDIPQSMALGGLWLHASNFLKFPQFIRDASQGKLPKYTFIEPGYFGVNQNDEHPPSNIGPGEALIAQVYNALRKGPLWSSTLLIITYDEHGGCYDHVPPPAAAVPTSRKSELFKFDRYGVRVPAVIVSPYIMEGTIARSPSDVPFDHTSIISTIRDRFGITNPLTKRDARAPSLRSLFTQMEPINLGPEELTPLRTLGSENKLDERAVRKPTDFQRSLLLLAERLPEKGANIPDHVRKLVRQRTRRAVQSQITVPPIITNEMVEDAKRKVNNFVGE